MVAGKSSKGLIVALSLIFILIFSGLSLYGIFLPWEMKIYDLFLRLGKHPKLDNRIVIISIDEDTYHSLGNRNPDRSEVAAVLERLKSEGINIAGIDIVFSAQGDKEQNIALQSALSRCDSVLAVRQADESYPLIEFQKEAVSLASIDLRTDRDGILRGIPQPVMEKKDSKWYIPMMPFAIEIARQVIYPDGIPDIRIDKDSIKIGNRRLPITDRRMLFHFCGGQGRFPNIPFMRLLQKSELPFSVRGAIALIGSTRAAEHDRWSVPLPAEPAFKPYKTETTNTMDGVEFHANALSAFLTDNFITRPVWYFRFIFIFFSGLTGLLIFFILRLKPIYFLSAFLSGILIIFSLALYLVSYKNFYFDGFSCILLFSLFGIAGFAYQRYLDFTAKQAIEKLFGRYVSPNIAKRLIENPGLVQLGGRKKVLSILFSDIRGFTSMSEKMAPEEVSAVLNEYFTEMTLILFSHEGTLDKFIGDALLAFFGDPLDQEDHAKRAIDCAIEMQERIVQLREIWKEKGKPELRIGIGINTGSVIVGNHGSMENFDYTVIGDAVNLASRLQGLAKEDDVIVSIETLKATGDLGEDYVVEKLEPVMVKGKSEPIPICRVHKNKERRRIAS